LQTKASSAARLTTECKDRLFDGVLDIFALIAGADGQINEREIALVRSYLESLQPAERARDLLALFERKASNGLDRARTIASLEGRYGYEDSVFLLWKAFELLQSDEILPVELEVAQAIGAALGLRPADLRMIEACSLNGSAARLENDPTSVIWRLKISDRASTDTVYLPLEGLLVEVFAVGQRYYFRQLDTIHPVHLGHRSFPPRFLSRFRIDLPLTIGGFEFRHIDMTFYFRQLAREGQAKTLYVKPEGISIGAYEEAHPESALRIDIRDLTITATALREEPPITLNQQPLEGTASLLPGDSIFVGETPVELRRLLIHYVTDSFRFDNGKERCRISNGLDADLHVIDDSLVRWDAAVRRSEEGLIFERGDCSHHALRNGAYLSGGENLALGDEFIIGPQRIAIAQSPGEVVTLRCLPPGVEIYAAEDLSHRFLDQSSALDRITFETRRGELVCVLGPSGCGKSTLLSVLTGVLVPNVGEVRIDGTPLRADARLQNRIGYVPQDDLLFENLTVFENLYFGARLRCPLMSDSAVRLRVERVLRETGLRDRRDVRVGGALDKKLSGGERKRLNIGLELTGENNILLLDEPTSGLSSHDAFRVVELLRHRTLRGDIVLVVAHQPSARLLQMFDKLLMLDKGGRLVFFGGIERAFSYFGVQSPPGVGASTARARVGDPGLLFEALEQARLRIDGTLDEERQHPPTYWQEKFVAYRQARFPSFPKPPDKASAPSVRHKSRRLVQFFAGFRRELTNKARNTPNLLVALATAAVLALCVGFACRALEHVSEAYDPPTYSLDRNPALPNFFFLSVIVAQFLGLAGSVQEIVKDRAILIRERMLKIPSTFYLATKFCTSMLILCLQLALYVGLAFWVLELRELYLAYWALLSAIGAVGVAAGLFVSALPRITEKMASTVIPLLLVPQIILAGADPFPFDRMAHLTSSRKAAQAVREEHRPPGIAQLMPSRWGYEALLCLQRDFSREFRDARDYHEAQSAIEVFGSRRHQAAKKKEHMRLYGLAVGDDQGLSRTEWQRRRDAAQKKKGNERADQFFHQTENLVAYKESPFGLTSSVYYDTAVLGLMIVLALGAALALLRYSRHLDDLWSVLVKLTRRAAGVVRAQSGPPTAKRVP
jgi:ABC-type multidrug transport system ATPase subunit